jgi:hypothetical protein
VPNWWGWENQGCGLAVTDLDGDGRPELIVFTIDNPAGENAGKYTIGWGLEPSGHAVDGWGLWSTVPGWGFWENQGAAIDILGDELVLLAVDNPAERNTGFVRVITLDDGLADAHHMGAWRLLDFGTEINPVHAALLHTGDVLFFAGSGADASDHEAQRYRTRVWHYPRARFTAPRTPIDLFCAGQSFLAGGRLLAAGGTSRYSPFRGLRDALTFNPETRKWSRVRRMLRPRWYPTLITLGDGRAISVSGRGADGTLDRVPEAYETGGGWRNLRSPGLLPWYAHLFLMADGRVFFSGGRMDDGPEIGPCILDLTHDPVPAQHVANLFDGELRNQSASVLLAPAQDQRVMIIGGGPEGKPDKTHATDRINVVDLTAAVPAYTEGPPLGLGRMHLNTVLLPDRTVFVSGGSLKQESEPLARLQAELYEPDADAWRLMATATVPRLYHSTALLLPDGRVVAAGGNPEGGASVTWLPPDPNEEMRLEVFSPPYLFRGPRPTVDAAPDECRYGDHITITTPQAARIRWVSLVRNGVTTHSFDSEQRLVDLEITMRAGITMQAIVPANPNLAPPGWYMLFLVDGHGVPSIARWVQLG